MDKQKIYEDPQFRLSIGKKLGNYSLYIKHDGEEFFHAISVPQIREIGATPRGELEDKLDGIDPEIRKNLKKADLSVDSVHLAICLTYINRLNTPRDSDLPSCVYGPIAP